jgi:hypothetical protein
MLELLIAGGASLFLFIKSRKFVRERLRFVDAIRSPIAPLAAGLLAVVAASPIAWLPVIGSMFGWLSVVLVGAGVAAGVSAGAKDTRRLPGT